MSTPLKTYLIDLMLQRDLLRHGTIFSLSACAAFLAACGLESTRLTTVQVVIPPIAEANSLLEERVEPRHALIAAPPATIAGFDCIAVNIMAPDILPKDQDSEDLSHAQILQDFKTKNYCSYKGITSAIYRLTPGQTNVIDVPDVPLGEGRIVELLGIKLAPGQTNCPTSIGDDGDGGENNEQLRPRYYYIGSEKNVRVGRDNNSVTITNEYSSITPKIFTSVECGRVPIWVSPTVSACTGVTPTPPATISGYQTYVFKLRSAGNSPSSTQVGLKILSIQPRFPNTSNVQYSPVSGDCIHETTPTNFLSYGATENCSVKYQGSGAPLPHGFDIRVRVSDASNGARFFESERYYPVVCSE